MIPVIGLAIGIVAGLVLKPTVPTDLQPYLPIAIVAAHLWDLRAQCEQQVRALTDAQQQLDALRDGKGRATSQAALEALQADLARVAKANLAVREAVHDALTHAEALAVTVSNRSER
jgi:hypothetical protein